jgi:hypothetical protein
MEKKTVWMGIGCLIMALAISLHHFVISGKLFDLDDMLHHEFFLALFLGAGVGIIVQTILKLDQH